MFGIKNINYVSRVYECEDGRYRFDILFYENLFITDNKQYASVDGCIDALCDYMKKLCAHPLTEPLSVQL